MIKLSKEELDKLNRQRKGVPGETYCIRENNNDIYFKANNQGFLYRIALNKNEITGTEEETIISKLDKYDREELIAMLDYLKEMKDDDIITVVEGKVSKCKSVLDNIVFSL